MRRTVESTVDSSPWGDRLSTPVNFSTCLSANQPTAPIERPFSDLLAGIRARKLERPISAVHWSHSQWLLADQKSAVRATLLKPPVHPITGSWRACVRPVPRSGQIAVAGVKTVNMVGRASDPELGMVFRDYFEVDDDGQIPTEVRRHDVGDITMMDQSRPTVPATRSADAEPWWHR